MSLTDVIKGFDGRDLTELRALVSELGAEELPALTTWACSQEGHIAAAATWLIKALVEQGKVDRLDASALIKAAHATQDWQAALHILQLGQYMPEVADRFVAQIYLHHPKPMVRAWALDCLARAALRGDGDMETVRGEVARVLRDGKASEKARARQVAKLL